jgi:hypothetical protein
MFEQITNHNACPARISVDKRLSLEDPAFR